MLNSKALAASASAAKVYVEDVFSTWLYTGTGSTQTITNGIDLAGEGGLVWLKSRTAINSGGWHQLFDTERGGNNSLATNATNQQFNLGGYPTRGASFGSTGFSIADTFHVNSSSDNITSWTFRKAAKFFDVVTFSKTTDNQVVNHNLGSTPGFVLIKSLDAGQWWAFHRATSGGLTGGYLVLNSTSTFNTDSRFLTGATSTTITVGEQSNGQNYVAYLFAHDAGGFGDSGNDSVVKCGSFTTDGSGNIGTVSLGWEPQWILTKRTDSTQAWYVWDSMRGMSLTSGSTLSPNNADAEVVMGSTNYLYPTATGFAGSGNFYGPNATVAYIAIRRGPMKTPTDATKVFEPAVAGISGTPAFATTFPPDLCFAGTRPSTDKWYWADRLRGSARLSSATSGAESASAGYEMYQNGSFSSGWDGYNGWNFRRAPGFFDVVAYTGTGVARTVSHNLGVAPEYIFIKRRTGVTAWIVYNQGAGADKFLYLNEPDAAVTNTNTWQNTPPTATQFYVGTGTGFNGAGDTYIAYLFATCPSVSKVGSYTGTGTTLSIDCGFTAGARLVIIKRTDSTGSWYVWDTARGIVSGNDPYLLLNIMAAEVTSTDYIDPLSSGFQISSTAPAEINASGGSYIFLAVA